MQPLTTGTDCGCITGICTTGACATCICTTGIWTAGACATGACAAGACAAGACGASPTTTTERGACEPMLCVGTYGLPVMAGATAGPAATMVRLEAVELHPEVTEAPSAPRTSQCQSV